MRIIGPLLTRSAALLLPRKCLVCLKPVRAGRLCSRCIPPPLEMHADSYCPSCFDMADLSAPGAICTPCRHLSSRFSRQRYLWTYHGAARDLIVAMKYRPSRMLTMTASDLLLREVGRLFEGSTSWQAIIPMPGSPMNYYRRLFNPARIIAGEIASQYGIALRADILAHSEKSFPQATRSEQERIDNARQSLTGKKRALAGESILLVDDVATTGATCAVAAHWLAQAGAGRIELLTLARASSWREHRRAIARRL